MLLKEAFSEYKVIDENCIHKVFTNLSKMGSISKLEEELSEELFYLYVYIFLVSSYQSDGWNNIIDGGIDINPFISETLNVFKLHDIKTAYEKLSKITDDDFEDNYLEDIFNYWDEIESDATDEQRKIHELYEKLDNISRTHWDECATNSYHKGIVDYVIENMK